MISKLILRRAAYTRTSLLKRAMASATYELPPWKAPQVSPERPTLKVYNSLTRSKNDFIPIDGSGNTVTWYCCGPTVYDAGHLGHARNYISTDILRRIVQDYFRYDVKFVMNITDIDDKIIVRARQEHLLQAFKVESSSETVTQTAKAAFKAYLVKNLPRLSPELDPLSYDKESESAYEDVLTGSTLTGKGSPSDAEVTLKMHIATAKSAAKVLSKDIPVEAIYEGASDILMPYLDSLYGDSIKSSDYSIFQKFTQYWEQHFREDLETLNCLPPTHLTRVTEYISENVEFVQKLVEKGFAYVTSDHSVYFDIGAFQKAGHNYARLQPGSRNDKKLQDGGEGSLSSKLTEKRSEGDFALWKSSKPGEPSWPSPWGKGRPGWHIECSVMCSEVLGDHVDIHSGGVDLAFPHHDNELAISEAYWTDGKGESHQWINYFLHMGHLSIRGSKMSKSLKNFTTIRSALAEDGGWTARALRIVFLQGGWKEGIEVTDDIVKAAKSWERLVDRFFSDAYAFVVEYRVMERAPELYIRQEEKKLLSSLDQCRATTHAALCDSFNTPVVMRAIKNLISDATAYMSPRLTRKTGAFINYQIIQHVAEWVTEMVRIFGLSSAVRSVGWDDHDGPSGDKKDAAMAPLRVLAKFRDEMRTLAMTQDDSTKKRILELCDKVRDVDLVNLGVEMGDSDKADPNAPIAIRFVGKEKLIQAQKEKAAAQASKEEAKETQRLQREAQAKEAAERAQIDEREMFRTAEYSAWDENGLPTLDSEGKELTKSRSKKLAKEWEAQKKRRLKSAPSTD